MDRRYRWFAYFLGVLLLGSILLDWLSGSIRVPEPPRGDNAATVQPPAEFATPPAPRPSPSEMAGPPPPYSPSYDNRSLSEDESSKVREAPSSDEPSSGGMANSSDLEPPAPPPTAASEDQGAPDRDQVTTSPKSSNAALREKLKSKGR
jgi:hypothetical protein